MQNFKFVNWRIGEFVFWCHKQVSSVFLSLLHSHEGFTSQKSVFPPRWSFRVPNSNKKSQTWIVLKVYQTKTFVICKVIFSRIYYGILHILKLLFVTFFGFIVQYKFAGSDLAQQFGSMKYHICSKEFQMKGWSFYLPCKTKVSGLKSPLKSYCAV